MKSQLDHAELEKFTQPVKGVQAARHQLKTGKTWKP